MAAEHQTTDELADMKARCDAAWAANSRLNDENARLRAALLEIADRQFGNPVDAAEMMQDIAEKALGRFQTTHDYPGPHAPSWKPYAAGGPGWRICKWCGLTQRPEERDAEARAIWKAQEAARGK